MGTCILYLIFVSRSVEVLIKPHDSGGFYYTVCALAAFPVLVPFALVRQMKFLLNMVYIGMLFMGISVVAIISNGIEFRKECREDVTVFAGDCDIRLLDMGSFPIFLGIVVFAMEGIQNIMPIHESMEEPAEINRIMLLVYGILWVLSASFGAIAYSLYANGTHSVISLSVRGDMGWIVKVLLSVMLFGSFPLQLFPVSHIIDHNYGWDEDYGTARRNSRLARIGLVFIVVMISISLPYFGNVLSLLGCTCVTFLGFVMPPWMALKFFKNMSGEESFLCYLTLLFSAISFVTGLYVNIKALIDSPLE
mmetsp:Transcript_63219/g.149820  ORF Transcript_63219/g.149820 Transcript_63219/m.149820 type:complete len:307 (-) Transcript_63219:43-963(-)